uniref:Single-stranded DNA-binding protein n=1 Tax=Cyclophora tenuis TaxID=216820 RepID=A0A7S1DC37_CYCTE|mmetsp:Transcript_8448/g.14375  ORF Transcript_8448/g.14375 Transcript_8448/m.14375 type:complete len:252 (+) Transcript_8448:3-758(+)
MVSSTRYIALLLCLPERIHSFSPFLPRSISNAGLTSPVGSSTFHSTPTSGGDFFDEVEDQDELESTSNSEDYSSGKSIDELIREAGEWPSDIPTFNNVFMVGRVGNDPEPKYLDSGKVVLNLSLAVKRKYHRLERIAKEIKSGEEETDWYRLEIWGQTAEYAAKYVTKGARIGLSGSLRIDQWEDRTSGNMRARPKIVVQELDILETRAEAELRRSRRSLPFNYKTDIEDDDEDEDVAFGPKSAGTGGFFD